MENIVYILTSANNNIFEKLLFCLRCWKIEEEKSE